MRDVLNDRSEGEEGGRELTWVHPHHQDVDDDQSHEQSAQRNPPSPAQRQASAQESQHRS